MSYLIDLLFDIRQRPGMYIGSMSVTKLKAFLDGFDHALHQFQLTEGDELFYNFQAWVKDRFKVTTSQSWDAIILFHSIDEAGAFKLFWELWDEYVSQCEKKSQTNDKQ